MAREKIPEKIREIWKHPSCGDHNFESVHLQSMSKEQSDTRQSRVESSVDVPDASYSYVSNATFGNLSKDVGRRGWVSQKHVEEKEKRAISSSADAGSIRYHVLLIPTRRKSTPQCQDVQCIPHDGSIISNESSIYQMESGNVRHQERSYSKIGPTKFLRACALPSPLGTSSQRFHREIPIFHSRHFCQEGCRTPFSKKIFQAHVPTCSKNMRPN